MPRTRPTSPIPAVPHSIYEIPGARECAIEFRCFSKNGGFTGDALRLHRRAEDPARRDRERAKSARCIRSGIGA